jgi:hypothetical protein
MANSLSTYSITENIYYSQLCSVAILLQPETVFTSYSTRKGLGSLSLCAIVLRSSPPSHVSTCNGQRSSQLFCVHYTHSVHDLHVRIGRGGPIAWPPRSPDLNPSRVLFVEMHEGKCLCHGRSGSRRCNYSQLTAVRKLVQKSCRDS